MKTRFNYIVRQKTDYSKKDVLTVSDVAEITGFSRPTIIKNIVTGIWPGKKHGRKYLVPRAAFFAALAVDENG